MRPRQRIEIWGAAQPFAYWIPPDITSSILDGFVRPQDVIVETHLPKARAVPFAEFIGRALLEKVDELEQVCVFRKPLGEKVNVIGHDAKSMEREVP